MANTDLFPNKADKVLTLVPDNGQIIALGHKITFPSNKSIKVTNIQTNKTATEFFNFEIDWSQTKFTFPTPPEKDKWFIFLVPHASGMVHGELPLNVLYGSLD